MIDNFEHIPEHPTRNQSQICRVCLTTNVKMFSLQRYEFYKKYQEITGLQISPDDKYPSFLCWECAHHLSNCHRFKTRAVLSHYLLSGLLETDLNITEQSVRKINRIKNGLVSRLKPWISQPNYCNLELTEPQTNDRTHYETQTNHQVEITVVKNEDDEFLPEDDIKKESVNVKEESSGDDFDDNRSDSSLDDDMPLVSVKHSKLEQKNTSANKPKVKSKTTKTTKTKQKTQIKSNVKGSGTTQKKSVSKKNSIEYLDPSTFDISDLTLEEQISEIEKRKKTKNYTKSNFKCENCYKGFSNETSFKFHMIRHSNESGEHECPVCKIHFKTFNAMRHHLSSHVQKYTCKHCDFTTTRRRHAKNHEEFHKGTKYKCTQCPEEFINSSTYLSHIRIKHPSDIVCELCGYSFISLKGLDLHKKLKHRFDEDTMYKVNPPAPSTELDTTRNRRDVNKVWVDARGVNVTKDAISLIRTRPEGDYSCEECGITFLKQEALDTHLNVSPKHTENVKGKERNCRDNRRKDRSIRQMLKRKREQKLLERKKPVQCELCDATLANGTAYHYHFLREHPGKNKAQFGGQSSHMCEVCGKMFSTQAVLDDHRFVHTGEKLFKCEICQKSFQRKYALANHISRVHSGKRRILNCNVCGKGFISYNLKRHMLIHTGLKPFECEMCGKFFKDVADRQLHVKHVHMKVPWPKKNRTKKKKQAQSQPPKIEAPSTNADVDMQTLWPEPEEHKITSIAKTTYLS